MTESTDRPLLRVLKCAGKLYRAGLTAAETVQYINNCRRRIDQGATVFPSAALSPSSILLRSFTWRDSAEGYVYWQDITTRMGAWEPEC